jgi:hypothetical protein
MAASACNGLTPLIFFETFCAVGFRDFFTRFGMSMRHCQPHAGDFGGRLAWVV